MLNNSFATFAQGCKRAVGMPSLLDSKVETHGAQAIWAYPNPKHLSIHWIGCRGVIQTGEHV